jgi:7-cyano-7-deazaguanine tRNA-ribosyltransferase
MLFSLIVALGCDLFDSAAYALYARENRYMTENGTWRLGDLDYFPCQCPKCAYETPQEVREKAPKEREAFLAEHNLYVCQAELKRIKQAIRDGRLWEHMEMRAHAHPALLTALKKLKNHSDFIEKHSPTVKRSGFFFFGSVGLVRPEVSHYTHRLLERYCPPENARVLLLAPQTRKKPFHKSRQFNGIRQVFQRLGNTLSSTVHVCFYAAPFGVIPLELDEVYPLSQHETALPLDAETIDYVAGKVSEYIMRTHYETVVLLHDPPQWGDSVKERCSKACLKNSVAFEVIDVRAEGSKNILTRLEMILRKHLSE